MTFEEYQQLLTKSVSFKELDEETRNKILNAQGVEKDSYIQAFQQEVELVHQAYADFVKDTDQVVTEFKEVAAKDQKEKLVKAESVAHNEELTGAENMLKKL